MGSLRNPQQGRPTVPRQAHGDGRFVVARAAFAPAYLRLAESGELRHRVEEAVQSLKDCMVCPRDCRVDRLAGRTGVCRSGRYARVSAAFPHYGEEDVLRGRVGSGTIFFAGCNLRCVFCQNFETSQLNQGEDLSPRELASLMLLLQERGCHNLNLVTPEHVVPQVLEALPLAIGLGLRLPIVYNTSAYDSRHSIRLLDGLVDIYMPDFKLWRPENALRYLLARDYPAVAREAIRAMHGQVGDLTVDTDGLALRGLLVRHLVMPGLLDDTAAILRFLADEVSPDTYLNLMDQYRPAWRASSEERYAEINRRPAAAELSRALALAREAGLWRLDRRRSLPSAMR